MPLATQVTGLTGTVADVDANNNLHVNAPLVASTAGFVSCLSETDHGTVTGARTVIAPYASNARRLSVGMATPLLDWNFNGAAQATGQWKCLFTTMTITEGSGSCLLNANSTATTTTGCALSTWSYFKMMGGAEMFAVAKVAIATGALEAGQIMELGLFVLTATTAPVDGVYFRITSAGTLCVVNFNGTETVATPSTSNFPTGATLVAGTAYELGITVTNDVTQFWINNTLIASIPTPSGNGFPFSSVSLPYTVQQRNAGAVSGAQAQLKVMAVHIEQNDLLLGMPFSHALAAAGQAAYQGQEGGTAGSTAIYPASGVGATAAVPAIGAAVVTGLGGTASVTVSAAINVDGIVFDYTVPAGGVSQVPRKLVVTGVQIQGVVTTAFVGGPVSNAWGLAFGHTAVSLATAEGASFSTGTTKAPRKVAIGIDTYPVTAAVGTLGSTVPMELDLTQAPAVVNPGEHVALYCRQLQAAATSGNITYVATFKGYWI